jgi:signal transduction histidine kinase
MLNRLRINLTIFYLMVAVALIAVVGGGSYFYLRQYFMNSTDLALQHQMAIELNRFGVPLPEELAAGEEEWCDTHLQRQPVTAPGGDVAIEGEDENYFIEAYDAELASIFVLPLSAKGELLFNPNAALPPINPDQDASLAAWETGCDWRTVTLANASRVRLYTHRLPQDFAPALLQVGRSLDDQDRVLRQFLMFVLILGGTSVVFLGGGSWWLAGRSVVPAQKAWQRQQVFVANASHELRAPLTFIRTSVEVALRSVLPDRPRELLEDVVGESDHMSALVEDLLLLSRLDAGKLPLKPEKICLEELLSGIARQAQVLADEKGIVVKTGEMQGQVTADRERLRQVLLIVLDNALHHTNRGGKITMISGPHGKNVAISVCDTGEGIPEEHLGHVFERFYRVSSARGKGKKQGSGLGLSIAKSLIDAQGGEIYLKSEEGKGTKVTICLPFIGNEANPSKYH